MADTRNAVEFAVAELEKNESASYAELKAKADKENLAFSPINYGRAKALLGLVTPKDPGEAGRAEAGAPSGRTGPRGSAGESKSERIRALLGTGKSDMEIAKEVGCSRNLVYNVKSRARSGTAPAASRARASGGGASPTTFAAAGGSVEALVAALKNLERERDDLRQALEKIRSVIDSVG